LPAGVEVKRVVAAVGPSFSAITDLVG